MNFSVEDKQGKRIEKNVCRKKILKRIKRLWLYAARVKAVTGEVIKWHGQWMQRE